MAKMVGQPIDVFSATMERMSEKGFVSVQSDGLVQLTAAGKDMAERLFDIAKAQEEVMLSELNDQHRADLKLGLKHIAEVHG